MISRSQRPDGKAYPGVRYHLNESGGGGTDEASQLLGMMAVVDIASSTALDTLLLPIDVARKPRPLDMTPPVYMHGIYRGSYQFGRERSDFTPVGTREKWWLTGDINELRIRMSASSANVPPELPGIVFVLVEGDLSPPGSYGHNDAYRREFRVSKIIEVQTQRP